MKVDLEGDLLELYTKGYSDKYKAISRNKELLDRFTRVVKTMELVGSVGELRQLSYLHYEKLKYNYSGYSSVRLSNSVNCQRKVNSFANES